MFKYEPIVRLVAHLHVLLMPQTLVAVQAQVTTNRSYVLTFFHI